MAKPGGENSIKKIKYHTGSDTAVRADPDKGMIGHKEGWKLG